MDGLQQVRVDPENNDLERVLNTSQNFRMEHSQPDAVRFL